MLCLTQLNYLVFAQLGGRSIVFIDFRKFPYFRDLRTCLVCSFPYFYKAVIPYLD